MNFNKLTKAALIVECEKRGLPTDGLKDQLVRRLKESQDSIADIDVQEENYDSEDEYNQDSEETLNDDENIKEPEPTTALTVDDAINMKEATDPDNISIVVNVNEDDTTSLSNTNKDEPTFDYDQATSNRDLDNNGEHEIIEISEEVIIDDEDNHDNDNNFNDETMSNNGEIQEDKDELELGEARDDDSSSDKEKINLWVYNVAEDIKAVDLKELFGKYGTVTSAKVVMNGNYCYGCVELNNQDDVDNCITNLNKTQFHGNIIDVSKEMSEMSSFDKIQRNISPISSSDSWGGGGDGKKKEKSISLPVGEVVIEIKDDDKDEEDNKSRPPFRSRGGFRGNNYGNRDDNRNKEPESSGRDYKRSNNDTRGSYGSRQERDEPVRQNFKSYNSDNRPRDSYPRDNYASRREIPRGGRDDYGSSRYQPVSRDNRPPFRDDRQYNDRPKSSRYYEDDGRSSKYSGSYEQDYERRSNKRIAPYNSDRLPASRDDYHSRSTRDEISFKRPRIDNDDHYHAKRFIRREDFSPERRGNSRDKYRLSPKRSFYYEKEFVRPDFRDKRDTYPSTGSGRDYYPRKPVYDKYSPERRPSRGQNYKESFATDFGGRSRNY